MASGSVRGSLRTAFVLLVGVVAFVAFGALASHLSSSVPLQVGVATAMGLIAVVSVRRVIAISEIPSLLSR